MMLRNVTVINPFRDNATKAGQKPRKVKEVSALLRKMGKVVDLNYTYVGNDSDSQILQISLADPTANYTYYPIDQWDIIDIFYEAPVPANGTQASGVQTELYKIGSNYKSDAH